MKEVTSHKSKSEETTPCRSGFGPTALAPQRRQISPTMYHLPDWQLQDSRRTARHDPRSDISLPARQDTRSDISLLARQNTRSDISLLARQNTRSDISLLARQNTRSDISLLARHFQQDWTTLPVSTRLSEPPRCTAP